MREIKLNDNTGSVVVYDTGGPYSSKDYIEKEELTKIREDWYKGRKDLVRNKFHEAKPKKDITQLYYARRRIITPEMEYVAIRENQQIEALGLKSFITPEFVRKEIAARHAVIPANINHTELEPMIIGRKFLVKVNGNYPLFPDEDIKEIRNNIIEFCRVGTDALSISPREEIIQNSNIILRNSPLPIGCNPLIDAWRSVDCDISRLSWKVFEEILTEEAKLGVDFVTLHPGFLRNHQELASKRLCNKMSLSAMILSEWMKTHGEENFIFTNFERICTILKKYDITLSLGSALRATSIYDANDGSQLSEWKVISILLTKECTESLQIFTEGPSQQTLERVNENIKEHLYQCKNLPFFTIQPQTTDICEGYEEIAAAIGAAQSAWHGASMLSMEMRDRKLDNGRINKNICALKIAAHSADLAKGHPGSQIRDNALVKARSEERIKDVVNLSLDPHGAAKSLKSKKDKKI